MKRILSAMLAIIILAAAITTMTACGEIVECDLCPKEDREGRMHHVEMWGEPVALCDDCYDELMEISREFYK